MKPILSDTGSGNSIRNMFIIAFILLLSSYLITLFANRQIINQIARVQHTNSVIRTLENIESMTKDAETAVRGFIITRDVQFLSPYYGSKEKTDSFYQDLLRLTSDNPRQQEMLRNLKKEVDTRFEQFNFSINSFIINRMERTDSMVKLQPATIRIMDNIRKLINVLQQEEQHLLTSREKQLKDTTKAIIIITIISLSLAFILVTLGFISYLQVSRARKKTAQEIAEYQSQLKTRINELDTMNMELISMRSLEKLAATGRIARAIAHEVRNPLTNINLAADQLKANDAGKDQQSTFLFEMINRNSTRINQLIADLLNSTKFADLNSEKISVNSLLDEALKDAGDRILLNKIGIVKDYKGNCIVSVDSAKMKIAFLNIIINAIEAMEQSPERVLSLKTGIIEGKCQVVISDTGPGMEQDSVARLFEAYFTNKPKGNGLGLTNTQNIILNHKGNITAQSTKGKGTSFTITLDLVS
ncbi:MAG: CHASE3 domain-containing protein [Chitinophagaceae bacterium]